MEIQRKSIPNGVVRVRGESPAFDASEHILKKIRPATKEERWRVFLADLKTERVYPGNAGRGPPVVFTGRYREDSIDQNQGSAATLTSHGDTRTNPLRRGRPMLDWRTFPSGGGRKEGRTKNCVK